MMNNMEHQTPQLLHSQEAEQAIIGGLLIEPKAFARIAGKVDAHDFYSERNRMLFSTIASLSTDGKAVDPITVYELVRRQPNGQSVDVEYIMLLADSVPSIVNIEHYVAIVTGYSRVRKVLSACERIKDAARSGDMGGAENVSSFIQQAENEIRKATENKSTGGLIEIGAEMPRLFKELEMRAAQGNARIGYSTGFESLDSLIGGLQNGHLIILAARPSMGKSALALALGVNVAEQTRKSVALFSLEMDKDENILRTLASRARVNGNDLRRGTIRSGDDTSRVVKAVMDLRTMPLLIDDSSNTSLLDIRSRCNLLQHQGREIGMVIVDYLQLMQGGSFRANTNRQEIIASYSRGLKQIARDLQCPVLALSQLNRDLEKRDNKRPKMADLRESGGLENDADLILMLYRDEVYHPNSADKGLMEVIVTKQRNGPIGTTYLLADMACGRFESVSDEFLQERKAKNNGEESEEKVRRNGRW
jgi:replicative DNA helicase